MLLTAGEKALGQQALLKVVCLHMGLHGFRKDPEHRFPAAVIMLAEIIQDHAVPVSCLLYTSIDLRLRCLAYELFVCKHSVYAGKLFCEALLFLL